MAFRAPLERIKDRGVCLLASLVFLSTHQDEPRVTILPTHPNFNERLRQSRFVR